MPLSKAQDCIHYPEEGKECGALSILKEVLKDHPDVNRLLKDFSRKLSETTKEICTPCRLERDKRKNYVARILYDLLKERLSKKSKNIEDIIPRSMIGPWLDAMFYLIPKDRLVFYNNQLTSLIRHVFVDEGFDLREVCAENEDMQSCVNDMMREICNGITVDTVMKSPFFTPDFIRALRDG